jgi:hypothetical protein
VKFKDFKSDVPLEKAEGFIADVWDSLLTTLKQQCQAKEDDVMRLSIHHDGLKSPVWIEFSSPAELTSSKVIDKIQHVQQSNDKFHITDGKATLFMTHVSLPQGTGRKKVFLVDDLRSTKKSLVQINNPTDKMCLARAIVVGRTYADKNDTAEWKRAWKTIQQSDRAKQQREAELLLQQSGISKDTACGIPEMQKLQDVLAPSYTLKVHLKNCADRCCFEVTISKTENTFTSIITMNILIPLPASLDSWDTDIIVRNVTMAITIESNTSIVDQNAQDV